MKNVQINVHTYLVEYVCLSDFTKSHFNLKWIQSGFTCFSHVDLTHLFHFVKKYLANSSKPIQSQTMEEYRSAFTKLCIKECLCVCCCYLFVFAAHIPHEPTEVSQILSNHTRIFRQLCMQIISENKSCPKSCFDYACAYVSALGCSFFSTATIVLQNSHMNYFYRPSIHYLIYTQTNSKDLLLANFFNSKNFSLHFDLNFTLLILILGFLVFVFL